MSERCTAILASGAHCKRAARAGSTLCSIHSSSGSRGRVPAFYANHLSTEEQDGLAAAAQLNGVDAEIAVLRILIRRVLNQGDLEAARRGIDTLCRTLKARHALDEQATGRLATSMERVLDSLGGELEVSL